MPVTIIAPTIVRLTMHTQLAASHLQDNIIDVSIDVLPTGTRTGAIDQGTAEVVKQWQDHIIRNGANTVTFLGASWIDLDNADGLVGSTPPQTGLPVTGDVSTSQSAPQVCYLIHKLSTARRGERQGRLFLSPVTESEVGADGALIGSAASNQTAHFEAFRSDIGDFISTDVESMAWRTVHVHKVDKNDSDTWTWSSSTIDAVRCDPQTATQRRRNRS